MSTMKPGSSFLSFHMSVSVKEQDAKDFITRKEYDDEGKVVGRRPDSEIEAEERSLMGYRRLVCYAMVNGQQQKAISRTFLAGHSTTPASRAAALEELFASLGRSTSNSAESLKLLVS